MIPETFCQMDRPKPQAHSEFIVKKDMTFERHDAQHNGTQHDNIHHNDNQHNVIQYQKRIRDTQHN